MPILYDIVAERGRKFVEIKGYEGKISTLVVPEMLEGYPVERIRGHAFEGRTDIREVYLPKSLRCLRTFVFHKCNALVKLSLYDGVDDYHDGVIRHCASLEEIEIDCSGNSYELVKELLGDNDRALHFTLHMPGRDINIMFPDYVVVASENTMARTIQFAFEGVGYAYRECVRKREIRWREYDSLFETMIHFGTEVSLKIAMDRLMYPVDLDSRYRDRYEAFVTSHAARAMTFFIESENRAYIDFSLEQRMFPAEAVDQGLKIASGRGETELCAVLMEYLRGCRGESRLEDESDHMLSLEDW